MTSLTAGTQAIVRTAYAPMHAESRIATPQVSQLLAGHAVDILDVNGEWCRVRGDDAYEGWVHQGYLAATPPAGARSSRGVARVSLGCVARTASGARRALPLRAWLAPEEIVQSGEALGAHDLAQRFPADAIAITRSAQTLFEGTVYVWGGVTPWGADCSGFVQSVFALHGVPLPRDASMQAESGTAGESELLAARPADLLFFSDRDDRRITHVGIALGEQRMVHVALGRGGFAAERLNDERDGYISALRSRFVTARRVL